LTEPGTSDLADDCLAAEEKFQRIVLTDRALHDKGQRAFVSWVRSYSKHEAKSIFSMSGIDWNDHAAAWGLLKMPKIAELKNTKLQPYQGPGINWDTYGYKDKQREKHRKQMLQEGPNDEMAGRRETDSRKRKKGTVAWSEKLERKATKEVKRSKKEARRQHDRVTKMTEDEKQYEAETARMIEQLRQQQQQRAKASSSQEDVFEGFG